MICYADWIEAGKAALAGLLLMPGALALAAAATGAVFGVLFGPGRVAKRYALPERFPRAWAVGARAASPLVAGARVVDRAGGWTVDSPLRAGGVCSVVIAALFGTAALLTADETRARESCEIACRGAGWTNGGTEPDDDMQAAAAAAGQVACVCSETTTAALTIPNPDCGEAAEE